MTGLGWEEAEELSADEAHNHIYTIDSRIDLIQFRLALTG